MKSTGTCQCDLTYLKDIETGDEMQALVAEGGASENLGDTLDRS